MSRHERRSVTASLQSSRHRQASVGYASLAWWGIRRQQTKSVSRRLFNEEFDIDCTRLTTRRQRNLPTTTTTISLAAYLPTNTTYWNSCFLTRQTMAQIPLGSTRLDSTRHIRHVEPMHFGCVELVEQHSSTRRARLARHVELDWLDTSSSTGATCNLVMITVIHLLFNKLFTD